MNADNKMADTSAATAAERRSLPLKVHSPNVVYSAAHIESTYTYQTTDVKVGKKEIVAVPHETLYTFRTERRVPK